MQLRPILHTRLSMLHNSLRYLRRHSLLKIVVIIFFIAFFLIGGYLLFYEGFKYLTNFPPFGRLLMDRLIALFFVAVFFMLIFSNIIVSLSTLYMDKELDFLIALPLNFRTIFLTKFSETIVFSSWAFVFLGGPLLLSFARVRDVSPWFYLSLIPLALTFILIPASLGVGITLMVARYCPLRKSRTLLLALGVIILPALIFLWRFLKMGQLSGEDIFPMMNELLKGLQFSQHPLLPSYWASEGLLSAGRADISRFLFFFLLLLANSLYLPYLLLAFIPRLYYPGWVKTRGEWIKKCYPLGRGFIGHLEKVFPFLSPPARALLFKDIRTFVRDPSQWTQFIIFFGLLAFYIANLRNRGYGLISPFWKNIISFLNLTAMGLTLSTLTTRFMFPLLSLEGKRFWFIGLAPLSFKKLLLQKFWCGAVFSFIITEGLMVFSNIMLGVGRLIMTLSCLTVGFMSLALSGLAVGLGAVFPNFHSDNPSRIVSGLGGTLDFILSLGYVLVCVSLLGLPLHLFLVKGILSPSSFAGFLSWAMTFIILLSLLSIFLPLYLGIKNLKKMEF